MSNKTNIKQSISAGNGNVQIGQVILCGSAARSRCASPPAPAKERMTIEQRAELTHIALQIELAEEGAVDAGTVWKALCNHLNGRGLEDVRDNTELSHEQYWAARSYLEGWLSCARGESLPRTGMIREIMRMWGIRGGLRAATMAFCDTNFGVTALGELTDVQLRAALWLTFAHWRAHCLQQASN
ncbi:hypothetical protein N5J06_02005 [Ralstonia sp. CHL-2022]|uniref:Uncharacterized protein n=1 Tax=Ralstonia mojiangensis TaxID=2953895 RepID=A0ABT2L2K1_9RALS|nr:hypothetical protein [Ralstonia mojiangensis]MCT7309705.1 hypothetical protein [Ralstonia mojiangensis]